MRRKATTMTSDSGSTALGIELGSTRIKAVLIGADHRPLASGSHTWENSFVDGMWTYSLDDVWSGVQGAVRALHDDIRARHGNQLGQVGAVGISAMMHGYLALDEAGELLVPFRTWRNSGTGAATEQLGELFGVNIPHRWSVAHHYQAVLDGEEHIARVAHLTTLAGYVHWRLTGERVLGVGDASGMFPIHDGSYDQGMVAAYDELLRSHGINSRINDLLPRVLAAGDAAGSLSSEGARLLDPTGALEAGAPLCPPEGDAGTGMVATNSIAPRTGNVSAGTSIFAMAVLEKPLSQPHREIDLVTTPVGNPVAMVHCNNGASEVSAWAGVFAEFAKALGVETSIENVFTTIFGASQTAAPDAAGITAFNYLAGEPITDVHDGRPLVMRTPDSSLTLANFARAEIYGVFATLRLGMDVLKAEGVELDELFAHGGIFATPVVAQAALAAALDVTVTVGESASEGGAWGMALLAAYAVDGGNRSLADFLAEEVFADAQVTTLLPDPDEVAGYQRFLSRFVAALPAQRAAATG